MNLEGSNDAIFERKSENSRGELIRGRWFRRRDAGLVWHVRLYIDTVSARIDVDEASSLCLLCGRGGWRLGGLGLDLCLRIVRLDEIRRPQGQVVSQELPVCVSVCPGSVGTHMMSVESL